MIQCPVGYSVCRLDTALHERDGFSCGHEDLDRFLQQQAHQDQAKNLSATHIVVEESSPSVIGYVTLVNANILLSDMPKEAKKITNRPELPAILLARMGVDHRHQKKRLGEFLVKYALYKSWEISKISGCHAIVVDAKSAELAQFYKKYGFIDLPDRPLRLYLPTKTIGKLFDGDKTK